MKYEDKEAWQLVNELTEAFQYYLLKASNQIAKEKGACDYFKKTKYSKGLLPTDTYKKDVDSIVSAKLNMDWEALRKDIVQHGLRHPNVIQQMPSRIIACCWQCN